MTVARPLIWAGLALLSLSACDTQPDGDSAPSTAATADQSVETPANPANEVISANDDARDDGLDLPKGTPMDQRVATIALLNKRNNITSDLKLKPGEERRIEDVRIRLSACERTPPWEEPPETGAFVQVDIVRPGSSDSNPDWQRIFSGWLFRNSPSLNVLEHPIYDVWVKDCAMNFPGEEPPAAKSES